MFEEALRQRLWKKSEMLEASLLPHQKKNYIKSVLRKLRTDLMLLEMKDDLDEAEKRDVEQREYYAKLVREKRLIKRGKLKK